MTRGKYARRAENRRDHQDLAGQAEKAEHQAERLTAELEGLQVKTARQIQALQSELKSAIAERDEAASPALTAAEQRLRALTVERAELLGMRAAQRDYYKKFLMKIKGLLISLGMANEEASQLLYKWIHGLPAEWQPGDHLGVHKNAGPAAARAIQTARGMRSGKDLAAELDAALADIDGIIYQAVLTGAAQDTSPEAAAPSDAAVS